MWVFCVKCGRRCFLIIQNEHLIHYSDSQIAIGCGVWYLSGFRFQDTNCRGNYAWGFVSEMLSATVPIPLIAGRAQRPALPCIPYLEPRHLKPEHYLWYDYEKIFTKNFIDFIRQPVASDVDDRFRISPPGECFCLGGRRHDPCGGKIRRRQESESG